MSTVLIYSDKGVDGGALKHLYRSLQQEIDHSKCRVARIDAHGLMHTPWEGEAALLIVPGGRDVFYHASLDGVGTDRIRSYVERGGCYLGICAGAYFASGAIEFEKGGSLEVCGRRSLHFFPGIAKGPAFGPNKYSYLNCAGVEAARISSEQVGECHVYFNGGCYFDVEEKTPQVRVVGRYLDLPDTPSAVLEIPVGKGVALLSGVHIEYIPGLLDREDPHLSQVIPILESADGFRRALLRSYLVRLGVPLNKPL